MRESPGAILWRRFRRQKPAMAGLVLLGALAGLALFAPLAAQLLGLDPEATDLMSRHAAPSLAHPLGTDELGRDLLLRLMLGGRISLAVALAAALAAALIGTLVGIAAGTLGGRPDAVLMRLTDGVIALPLLPLLIVLAAVDLGKLGVPAEMAGSPAVNLARIVLIIALVGWTGSARLVRGAALSLRERDFVLAAIAQGAGPGRVMFVHILPNALSPMIVAATLSMGNVILLESALSFLGLGIQPPTPSWGNMLSGALETIWSAPLLVLWPGLAIFLTVVACNLIGDGIQTALDPKAENQA